jgi:hypothetical protein
MNKDQQISNVFTVKVERQSSTSNNWRFGDGSNSIHKHRFMFRPNTESSALLIELTCLIKLKETTATTMKPMDFKANINEEYFEMACGFVQVDLANALTQTAKPSKLTRIIIGGSLQSQTNHFEDTNNRAEKVQPSLTFTICEAMYLPGMTPNLFQSLQHLPCFAIVALDIMGMFKIIAEMLTESLRLQTNNSTVPTNEIKDLALSSFVKLLNENDLLIVLNEVWTSRLRRLDQHRNEKTTKQSDENLKSEFRELLMQVWVFIGCSKESFPPLILDVTDQKRSTLFRACLNANPLQVATHDGINLQSHVTQSTLRAIQETQAYGYMDSTLYHNSPIEFENIFKPFDASEAFIPCNIKI